MANRLWGFSGKTVSQACLAGMMIGLLLSACSGQEPPPVPDEAPPVPIPSAPQGGIVTEPVAPPTSLVKEEVSSFQYNPEGRRDPFRSVIEASIKTKNMMNLPPLQRIAISDVRLIGIVWGGFGFGAIIQTPDGKGYPIRKGTRIGLNEGVVRRITQEEVLIHETFSDIFGEIKTRNVVLKLHPRKEGLE
ncbi:MAG: pilus assembly protein PilP [Nitrospiria bacterium]